MLIHIGAILQADETRVTGPSLLTAPQLLDTVEALLPEHRERLFPPTETLSMFLAQAMSADASCQKVVNDAAVRRIAGKVLVITLLPDHSGCLLGAQSDSGRQAHD